MENKDPKIELIDRIFDAKTLSAGGGIIATIFLSYVLFKVLTNDLTHINATLEKENTTLEKQTAILEKLDSTVSGNTEVIRGLERSGFINPNRSYR